MYKVTFYPINIEQFVEEGSTILNAARQAGIILDAPCGGNGNCKKCKVTICAGGRKKDVLACKTFVLEDLSVYLPEVAEHHILSEGKNFPFFWNPILKMEESKTGNGALFSFQGRQVQLKLKSDDWYMVAFDIGTTTIVGYLMDGSTGKQIAADSMLNPQTVYGADVMERCRYAAVHGATELQTKTFEGLNQLLHHMRGKIGINKEQILAVSIAGNVCMNHFLAGISIESLLKVPYHPGFYRWFWRKGKETMFHMNSDGYVLFLPNIGGFVGADTSSAMLNANLDETENLSCLIDIGTNGEIVIGNKTTTIACSTAAGPALEGANIVCGMRGASGAIDHVWMERGQIAVATIDKAKPAGICGSGLIDAVAVMLSYGFIDKTGRICEKKELKQFEAKQNQNRLCEINGEKAFILVFPSMTEREQGIYITQQDIRELQLAKAAILAGILSLLKKKNWEKKDIKNVFLSGAFGSFMSIESAFLIGLIPKEWRGKTVVLGNAAGEGAKEVLCDEQAILRCEKLARQTEVLELASDSEFQKMFLSCMDFAG